MVNRKDFEWFHLKVRWLRLQEHYQVVVNPNLGGCNLAELRSFLNRRLMSLQQSSMFWKSKSSFSSSKCNLEKVKRILFRASFKKRRGKLKEQLKRQSLIKICLTKISRSLRNWPKSKTALAKSWLKLRVWEQNLKRSISRESVLMQISIN